MTVRLCVHHARQRVESTQEAPRPSKRQRVSSGPRDEHTPQALLSLCKAVDVDPWSMSAQAEGPEQKAVALMNAVTTAVRPDSSTPLLPPLDAPQRQALARVNESLAADYRVSGWRVSQYA